MKDASTAPAHSAIKVLAALAELGEATAAAVAEHAGVGYSTTTPKLRAWEDSGQAERVRTDDGRTLWRLTEAGRAATATPNAPPGDQHRAGIDPQPAPHGPRDTTQAGDPVEQVPAEDRSGDQPLDPAETTDVLPAEAPDQAPTGAPDAIPAATVDNTIAEDGDATGGADQATTGPTGDGQDRAAAAGTTSPEPDGPLTPAASGCEPGHQLRPADDAAPPGGAAAVRRTAGSLRGAILDILQAHPGQQYKISELCRLIDAAHSGTDAKKASAGAVHNAAMKLVQTGAATLAVEKPATFTLAGGAA